jgi:hypothetical protein
MPAPARGLRQSRPRHDQRRSNGAKEHKSDAQEPKADGSNGEDRSTVPSLAVRRLCRMSAETALARDGNIPSDDMRSEDVLRRYCSEGRCHKVQLAVPIRSAAAPATLAARNVPSLFVIVLYRLSALAHCYVQLEAHRVQYVQNRAEIRMLFSSRERAVEACPFDARTAREFCNVVASGAGLNGVTNFGDITGLERGIDAFRNRSAARSGSNGTLSDLARHKISNK